MSITIHFLRQRQSSYTTKKVTLDYFLQGIDDSANYDANEDDVRLALLEAQPTLRPGYFIDSLHQVQKVSISRTDGEPSKWDIVVNIESPENQQQENESVHPLSRPPVIGWDFELYQEVAEKDVSTDKFIVNILGRPVDGIMRDRSRPVLRVTRNESYYSAGIALAYANKMNSSVFAGAGVKQALSRPPKADYKVESWTNPATGIPEKVTYWEVTYEFHFNTDTWDPIVLQADIYEKGSDGNVVRIKDGEGNDLTDPIALDSSGKAIRNQSDAKSKAQYFQPQIYETTDFNVLGLPV